MRTDQPQSGKTSGGVSVLKDYGWSLLALGVLLGGLLSAKGGSAILIQLGRYLVPIVLIVLVYKFLKKKLAQTVGAKFKAQMESMMQQMQQQTGSGDGSGTIRICSKCGKYQTAGHKC